MSADYLESIMASQLADAAADAAAAAVEQEAAAEDEDPASLHDDQMVDISDTTIVSNQAAPPPPLPPRLELPKLKPGETVWIPSRKCVATVQANNPFFKVMHCTLEDGSSLELPYAELQAQAASNGNATEHSHALSSAIAGLESQVHFLARELERAPDAAQRRSRAEPASASILREPQVMASMTAMLRLLESGGLGPAVAPEPLLLLGGPTSPTPASPQAVAGLLASPVNQPADPIAAAEAELAPFVTSVVERKRVAVHPHLQRLALVLRAYGSGAVAPVEQRKHQGAEVRARLRFLYFILETHVRRICALVIRRAV